MAIPVYRSGKYVYLRPLSKEDVPLLTQWINDPDVTQYLNRVFPASFLEEEQRVENVGKSSEHEIVLGMCLKTDELIGTIGLHHINWINRTAITGTLIGAEEHRGKGYGTDTKMLLLDVAFNALGLRKIASCVFSFNGRSARYSEKCGYRREGVLKQHHFHNGEYHDELILAVFRDDWLPLWEAYRAT